MFFTNIVVSKYDIPALDSPADVVIKYKLSFMVYTTFNVINARNGGYGSLVFQLLHLQCSIDLSDLKSMTYQFI